jgi:hypothetical protein
VSSALTAAAVRKNRAAVPLSEHCPIYMFDGVRDVREWVSVAYNPELAATLGSCMQDMMHCLKAGLEGQPNVTPAT